MNTRMTPVLPVDSDTATIYNQTDVARIVASAVGNAIAQYEAQRSNLENCTDDTQMLLPKEGDSNMAKQRIRICIGNNDDGSPVEKMVSASTQFELGDKIVTAILNSERRAEFLDKIDATQSNVTVDDPVPTFREYTERWLSVYKEGKLKPKTLKGYKDMLKCHLFPTFGDLRMDIITAAGIQSFLNDNKTYSQKSLQEWLNLLRQILKAAMTDKLIDSNQASDKRIYIPSNIIHEREALKEAEWQDVISNLNRLQGTDRLYMAIIAFTGMRRGEVLGLRWEDVDLDNNVIHVRRNVTHISNQPIIGTPKTERGKRDVPIMAGLLNHLSPVKESGYIITREKDPDKPLTISAFRTMWKRIKNTIDVHGATGHVFRHTMGTALFYEGADIKTIQSIVGHADIKTTMDTYIHVRDDRKQSAMEKLNRQISA